MADAKAALAALLEWLKANSIPRDYRRSAYFAEIQRLREEWLAYVQRLAASEKLWFMNQGPI